MEPGRNGSAGAAVHAGREEAGVVVDSERVWGEAYVRRGNTALRRALIEAAGRRGMVLEAGCGAGRFIRTIKRLRPEIVAHGCDIGRQALRLAAEYPEAVAYTAASVEALPYQSETFDALLMFDVLEHVDDPDRTLAEFARVLRPGGVFHGLVPCEGEPLTLHWLTWRLGIGGDLKERHGAHVQRFSQASLRAAVERAGLTIRRCSFSMHPIGQIRDVLTYAAREPWFRRWRLDNSLYRTLMQALWVAAYVESNVLLKHVPLSATAVHLTAVKPG